MESDDEMAAMTMEDSYEDEEFYDGGGDGDADSDPDGVVMDYDGFMDHDSDDSDDLSSSHHLHYHHRSQVIVVISLNHHCDVGFILRYFCRKQSTIELGRYAI